jgi:hypothetical protein
MFTYLSICSYSQVLLASSVNCVSMLRLIRGDMFSTEIPCLWIEYRPEGDSLGSFVALAIESVFSLVRMTIWLLLFICMADAKCPSDAGLNCSFISCFLPRCIRR